MAKNKKEIEKILDTLIKIGWHVEKTGKNHYRCIPKDKTKPPLLIASTPRKDRSLLTTKVRLRNEYGVDLSKIKL